MRSTLLIILIVIVPMVYQSCENTLDVHKPQDFYKYIGDDGNQAAADLVTDPEGNVYILGSTTTPDLGIQLYVVMTNTRGEVQWTKTYGDSEDETPKDIEIL